MRFSIITLTYKRLINLKKLYQNLLSQNKNKNKNLIEWIVVVEKNDQMTISYLNKIKKTNSIKVKIVKNKFPGNFSHLVSQGIELVNGQYICVVGDDDYFYPNALSKVEKAIINFNSPQIILGHAQYRNSKNKIIRRSISTLKNKIMNLNSRIILGFVNYYMCPAVFFSKNLIKKVNLFPRNYSNINDYITWLHIRNLYKPVVLKTNIASVGFDKGTISHSFNFEKYIFMWKIYLNSKNHTILFPLKIIFSIILLIFNFFYRLFILYLK